MPCNSDYLKASNKEIELSKVACLLNELDGKPINESHWRGYHPTVYDKAEVDGDAMVSELCKRLQVFGNDVTQFSLEMQMWWRDHKAADEARLEREIERQRIEMGVVTMNDGNVDWDNVWKIAGNITGNIDGSYVFRNCTDTFEKLVEVCPCGQMPEIQDRWCRCPCCLYAWIQKPRSSPSVGANG